MTETETRESKEREENTRSFPYMVSVRFHNSSRSYSFGTDLADLKAGDQIVVETSQGVELGECQSAPVSTSIYKNSRLPLKPVLRIADAEDKADYEENQKLSKEAYKMCQEEINALGLKMHLLRAEYMLDRTKILFVYQSEERVDFRELLKVLGSKLHCRIELRQIGERDKAKIVGGIGMCGMECCCSRFKTHMEVVSINMAKNQLLALNTEKLSGMCGKLMCCLRYENDNYKVLTEGLPKMGAHVEYEGNMYRVTSMNVMTNEARLENAESYQLITIQELRDKAVVKKGIAIARKSSKHGPKKDLTHGEAARQIPGVHAQNISASGPMAINHVGISSESKIHTEAVLKPAREHKPHNMHEGLIPQAGTAQAKKNTAPKHRQTVRKLNHMDTGNNPNITVRSFKSSHTRAAEAKAKEEKS